MRLRYPKSFFKLLAVGFFLGVLPLAAGLLANTLAIKSLARQSQQAVFDAARIAQGSRLLAEAIPALERSARQSVILQDAEFHAGYQHLRKEFQEAVLRLQGMPLNADMRELLAAMLREEAAAFVSQQAGSAGAAELGQRFTRLAEQGNTLLTQAGSLIEREAASLRQHAQEAEASTQVQLLIVLPLALLIVAGFTYLLARPIAQLEAGIRNLGEHNLGDKVLVEGPEDLVQLGEKLDWLRLRMLQLEAQKSQFMRHVSHELKTPLTALREGSELLTEGTAGALQARQLEIATIVRDNSIHLQQLIEDLLRHGEAEFRATSVEREDIDLAELVAQVAAKQHIALAARQLSLLTDLKQKHVVSDRERLRSIIDNLLSNAVKHAPTGSVIQLSASQSEGVFSLRLQDAGPGVAEAERERIFEPFFRGTAPSAGKVKSSGLGLSICQDHVRALGGHISVGQGHGDFLVQLPVHNAV